MTESNTNNKLLLSTHVLNGEEAIRRLVSNSNFHCTPIYDLDLFVQWSKQMNQRKLVSDSEFRDKINIRELRRENLSAIRDLESKLRIAKDAFKATSSFSQLMQLDRDILGGEKAVANMQKLLTFEDQIPTPPIEGSKLEKTLEKINHVKVLLPVKERELTEKIQLRSDLRKACPEYDAYVDAVAEIDTFYREIGLIEKMENMSCVQKLSGQRRNHRGKSFEDLAEEVIQDHLIPKVASRLGFKPENLFLVRNIKMGMASMKGSSAELDCLICVKHPRPERMDEIKPKGSFCKVLAVVEVKRNADDLGEAFLSYQQALTWLAGLEDSYDPEQWKNKAYPSGHFKDRPFLHGYNGEVLIFTPESFSPLRRRISSHQIQGLSSTRSRTEDHNISVKTGKSEISDSGLAERSYFVDDLFFVTKDGRLDCLHSKVSWWAANQIAEDTDFDLTLSSSTALENLRLRLLEKFPLTCSSMELIEFYEVLGVLQQVFLVGRFDIEDKFNNHVNNCYVIVENEQKDIKMSQIAEDCPN